MGKRSNFDRKAKDFYETPVSAVIPLISFLGDNFSYIDPCCGQGNIGGHISDLANANISWVEFDINEYSHDHSIADAINYQYDDDGEMFITNPPWDRSKKNGEVLHKIIDNLASQKPTWLLFDADWMHTKQSAEYMKYCVKVVSVGRVKWFPETNQTGKDNVCWYLFDKNFTGQTEFYGR